jgi:2-deoxy-D-gluconate 3-dehydrogenase
MNLFSLEGKIALVTGGNGGIGLGMAKGLLGAGAKVLLVGRNAAKNKHAVDGLPEWSLRVKAIEVDVAQDGGGEIAVAAAIDLFGRLDILVNNAGTNIRKPPQDYSIAEWRMLIDVNLTSAFLCSQAAYWRMRSTGGKIINIGSMTSLFGASFAAPYGASKGGVVQLTKALASAWAKNAIQVNAVLPGWIDTELTRAARKDVPDLHDKIVARTPAGRWGTPDDLAGIAVFLASNASDFITGAAIAVDGGYSAQG